MAQGNTAFFANEPLFDMIMARYVAANGNAFGGSKPVPLLGIEFVFGLDAPPTVQLAPQQAGGNIAFRFDRISLSIYAYQDNRRGELKSTLPVQVTVTGTLGLNGQYLGLTGLRATGGGKLDKKAAAMMNETVIPQFQAQVAAIPLPDFTKVVGLPVSLTGLQVEGNRVQVFAQVGSSGDVPTAPAGNPDFPAITASIGGGVINELAGKQFPGAAARVGDQNSSAGFGYKGEAWAQANNPQVYISNGEGLGSIHVSAGASGGIQAFGHWVEHGISVGINTPPLNLRLVNRGNGVTVKVYLNGNISLNFGLPGVLEKVAGSILSVIRPLADAITGAINSGLDHINIDAFTLPDTIPGTGFPASLSFADTSFRGNAVQAVIRVS